MSRRQYPRLGRIDHQSRWARLPQHEGPRCIVCGGKALYKVHVEFDIFRGDDEVLKACGTHSGDVRALVSAWSASGAFPSEGAAGRMNPEIKARWVAALRSGEYVQTQHFLRRGNGFCCLGVLCDLHKKAGEGEWSGGSYDGLSMGMPAVVGEWAGVEWGSGPIVRVGKDVDAVAVHNDNGCTFAQIADAIEEQL